jgi:hypothetical protein
LHPAIHGALGIVESFRKDNPPGVWTISGSWGGEIIHDLHYDSSLRKRAAELLLRNVIHEDGTLIPNGSEEEQRSFDSTCRKLHRYLTSQP